MGVLTMNLYFAICYVMDRYLIGDRISELPIKSHQFSIGSFFFVTRTWIINLEVLFLAEVLGKKPTSWRFKNCCLAVSERFLASHLVFFFSPRIFVSNLSPNFSEKYCASDRLALGKLT